MSFHSRMLNWTFDIGGRFCVGLCFAISFVGLTSGFTVAQQNQGQTNAVQNGSYNAAAQPQQQQTQHNMATPAEIQQASIAAAPTLPPGFPLKAEDEQYINQLVAYWENASNDVQRYECKFTRWQYDHEICNYRKPENNHLVASAISMGKIRYSNPDKGMYEINEIWTFKAPPKEAGGEPQYQRPAVENPQFNEREKWICDGTAFYEFDYANKRLVETKLPPELQGAGLKNSPLPFVFGAKATELLERFWIRDVTPQQLHGQQYWLEAWPKKISDAQAYQKVEIILSREPFLPIAVHMYAPNYNEKTNPSKMVFQFEERQINGTLNGLADFMNNFINPRPGFGWKRVTQKFAQDPRAETAQQQVPLTGSLPKQDR